ncbi:MAG: hypothetical protein V3V97_20900 [Hyphomicrobiaceae bacterium]
MKQWLILAILVTFGAGEVAAFSKKEIADAAYHWGRVDFAAKNCKRLGTNKVMRREVDQALAKTGKKAWKSGYELGQSEAKEFLEGSGAEAFCELAWVFYGRNGQSVKNLLVRR